jgi:hypothetical protein
MKHAWEGRGPLCPFTLPREGRSPLCHRQDCLCHSAERKRTLWEGHGPRCPPILADRGDAVPAIAPFREGHRPLCHRQDCLCHSAERERTLWEGRSPLRLPISRTARTRSLPLHHSGGAPSPVPQAGLPVPRGRAKTHPLGGAQSSVPVYPIPGGAPSPVPQAGLPVPLSRAKTHPLGGAQSSVPVYPIPGGAPSPVPQAGLPVPLSRARTHPLGGAQSSAPANPCLRACQFLRTARTPSLPFHHSGGPQSPVPQAGLPVPRGRAKTHPLGGARSSVPVNSCGRRGRRPSQRSIQ